MSKRILLAGCGQLGSRHLQAMATLADVGEMIVVDPNPAALELGKSRLGQVNDLNPSISYQWLTDLGQAPAQGDLCVVATQAKGRLELIEQICSRLGYRRFLIEKIVTQSMEEYRRLLALAERERLSIWVNCQTRTFSVDQYIKKLLRPQEPILLSDVGGNHGLATYGVHVADLFLFFDGTNDITLSGIHIEPVLHPSKRGTDLFDLSGTITGYSEKGSHLIMSFAGAHQSPDIINLITPHSRFVVDHIHEQAFESHEASGWKWNPIAVEGNWVISQTSRSIVKDILVKGTCGLPTLSECFPSHAFILNALKPAFERLLGSRQESCPVT